MKRLQAFFESHPESRILDIGIGSGQFVGFLASLTDHHQEMVGIDMSEGGIAAATARFSANPRIRESGFKKWMPSI